MPLLARRAASATERTLVYFRMNMYIRPPMRLCFSTTHQSISGRCWTRVYFRDGSIASFWTSADDFRSYPGNGHRQRRSACLKSANKRLSLDHIVSLGKQSVRHGDPEDLGGFEVDEQFEFGGLFDGESSGLCTLEDLVHIAGGAPIQVGDVRPVRHQAPAIDIAPNGVHRWQPVLCRQVHDALSLHAEHRSIQHN